MSHFAIRLMSEADADVVRHLDQQAFGHWMRRRGQAESMPLRTRENIRSMRGRDPDGCFVAEVEGRPVGYVFSRTWGRVGWFGTLGVHPHFQGRGIGRALIQESVAYLDRRGCTTIGLGTMPEEPDNVALYARCGFRPDHLTVILTWPAAPVTRLPAHARFSQLPSATQERLLQQAIPRLSSEVRPGLDYSPEVNAAWQEGYGETLLLGDPDDPLGFAVARIQSKWEGYPINALNVEAGALAAGEEGQTEDMLRLLADFAARHELPRVVLPMNSVHWPTLQQLLVLGCRAIHTRLRMVLRQAPARANATDFSTWAA